MIDWSKYFDHIYCIHYLPYKDRLEKLESELLRVGILDSGIFSYKNTVDNKIVNHLLTSTSLKYNFENINNPGLLKCALAHYEVYKEADVMDYKRILILEDDICFHNDLNFIYATLESLPADYDLVMLDRYAQHEAYYMYVKQNSVNNYFGEHPGRGFDSCGGYCVSTKGYRSFIHQQENCFRLADRVFMNNLNNYVSITPPCCQKLYKGSWSHQYGGDNIFNVIYARSGIDPTQYNLE